MNCWVRCLEMDVVWGNSDRGDSGNGDSGGGGHAFGSKGNNYIWIVLNCLLCCAICHEQECGDVGRRNNGGVQRRQWMRILFPPNLQPIRVLANHCVKKNKPYNRASTSSGGIDIAGNTITAMQAATKLAPNLDILSFSGKESNRSGTSLSLALRAIATTGRFLLCYLFYQSLLSLLCFSSPLLFLLFLVSSHGGGGNNTALCCSILQMSFNKFIGMSPNTMEHATLLMGLLRFHPSLIQTMKLTTMRGQWILNNAVGAEQHATNIFVNYCVWGVRPNCFTQQCGYGGWQQLGLSMALSGPQMQIAVLNAICNLSLEEETLRIRRGKQTGVLNKVLLGGKINLSIIVGSGRPWMKCWVHLLEMDVVWGNSDSSDGGNGNGGGGSHAFGSKVNNGISIVLNWLLCVWEVYDWMVKKLGNIGVASMVKSCLLSRGNLSMESCSHGNNHDMPLVATISNRLGWDSFVEGRVTTLWIPMENPLLAHTSPHFLARTWG
jgi:hypothetical protein